MKRGIITILVATALYAIGYGAVNLCFGELGKKTWTDLQGTHHELHIKGTHFRLPASGFPRLSKQVLYWGFYPVGWVNHKMNGREYGCVDEYSGKYYGL